MKTKHIYFILCVFLAFSFARCTEGIFDFDQEQYKKTVYIMSNNAMIYDRMTADLDKSEDTLYITVGVGGTLATTEDIAFTLEPGDSLFKAYNKSNFDIDSASYARLLPSENYTIPLLDGVIKAGENTAIIPVYLKKLDRLSPDSIYFLDYKIKQLNKFEINKDKKESLFRIHWKNKWSETKNVPIYSVMAQKWTENKIWSASLNDSIYQSNNDTSKISASPKIFPLGKNKVRVAAGSEKSGTLQEINSNSIMLEITENNDVIIKPYQSIYVEQINGNTEYCNKYIDEKIVTPGGKCTYYKTFMLHYRYKTTGASNKWIRMQERLRLQYNPLADK
ncbi:MAG: DUF4361 domain-containing protein [Paludibacter sp.]|nr:DUF4361 domain-containing protein [Paludibacter sp.]